MLKDRLEVRNKKELSSNPSNHELELRNSA
jgi:hypothetical protein